jgi:hypothetical protein
MLQSETARTLLAEFEGWVSRGGRESVASRNFAAITQFFFKLDEVDDAHRGKGLAEWLQNAFSAEEFRRMGIVTMFLTDAGYLLSDSKARSETSTSRKIASVLKLDEHVGWSEQLLAYAKSLATNKETLSEKTRYNYLKAAEKFLRHVDTGKESQATQARLVSFLRRSPGYRASIFPFVKFLSDECDVPIKVPSRQTESPIPKNLAAKLAEFLGEAERASGIRKRLLIAKALSVLFGVQLRSILELTEADLDTSVDNASVRIKGEWISAKSYRDLLLKMAPAMTTEPPASQKLFPGRNATDALSTSGARYHLVRSARPNG